jgi:hypothetical protein
MKRLNESNESDAGNKTPERGDLQDSDAADVVPDGDVAAEDVVGRNGVITDDRAADNTPSERGAADRADGDLDPFDPAKLRLSESGQIGVRRVLTTISCDKPGRQQFVRVHPDPEFRVDTAIFKDEINRESYLVDRSLWDELAGDIQPTTLFAAITRRDTLFLWPVRIPDPDRPNQWHVSQRAAVQIAITRWIRMSSNVPDGRYDVFEATGDVPEPEWPDMDFREMLTLCFSDRFIDSLDHSVLQQLRGAV